MLSKRNLVMMLTLFGIVLLLFISTAVIKEYFNDYDINHAALEDQIPFADRVHTVNPEDALQHVVYVGARDTGYYRQVQEWAEYRKMSYEEASDVPTGIRLAGAYEKTDTYLLLSGEVLENNTQTAAEALQEYVHGGGIVIFCSLPSYETIKSSYTLTYLLGIQGFRAESVALQEIRLFQGFLLGGEVHYQFDGTQPPERVDMTGEIPWYDISARTKSYMVGFVSEASQEELGLLNEDMPAIIWRSNAETGSVFAVNGDFMEGAAALGILDAMVYETRAYALYAVVNAQNLSVTGFPDLTLENEVVFTEKYGYDPQQFSRDVLWPSLVASATKNNWKISAFLSVKQSNETVKEAKMDSLIEYLKFLNEESAEAGIVLGRKADTDIRLSLQEDKDSMDTLGLDYAYSGGYIRAENEDQITKLLMPDGSLAYFPGIRTVVSDCDAGQRVFSRLSDQITGQRVTIDGYRYTYMDDFLLKSLQTALGYSNVQADIYRIIWPENSEDTWESVSEKFASHIDTYWKPFAVFDKTTITESDRRLRIFFNERITDAARDTQEGKQLTIQVENFAGDSWLMLRTHGEQIKSMEGGTWDMIEENAYLLHLTADTATVVLGSDRGTHYYKGK